MRRVGLERMLGKRPYLWLAIRAWGRPWGSAPVGCEIRIGRWKFFGAWRLKGEGSR